MSDQPKLGKEIGIREHLLRQSAERSTHAVPPPPTSPAYIDPTLDDPGEPAPITAASIHLPDYLHLQLKHETVARSCTLSFLILEALKDRGYGVSEADLIPDKRRKT